MSILIETMFIVGSTKNRMHVNKLPNSFLRTSSLDDVKHNNKSNTLNVKNQNEGGDKNHISTESKRQEIGQVEKSEVDTTKINDPAETRGV